MSLTRAERFRLKLAMLEVMDSEGGGWDFSRKNMLLAEFGLATLATGWDGPAFESLLADVPDVDLLEMFSVVTGLAIEEARFAAGAGGPGNWKQGYIKLFISHSAAHRAFVGEVANELAVVGIHGFVAHDTMEFSKPWQEQIELALRSMDALVAIVHPEFPSSSWCQQEVGWALGRNVPRYVIRAGADPVGFIGREQWPSVDGAQAKHVAGEISKWIAAEPGLGDAMVDGLLSALEQAKNYMDAGAAGERLAALGRLTPDQWVRLDAAYLANDQLYGGVLPTRALEPLYRSNERTFPPPRDNDG